MRDIDRIPRLVGKLLLVWGFAPDLRLGQIIDNAHHASRSGADIFNVEDDVIEDGLDELLIQLRNNS